MAYLSANKKHTRQSIKHRLMNRSLMSKSRTFMKKIKECVETKQEKDIMNIFNQCQSAIGKTVKKNIIHEKKGSKIISKLHKLIKNTFPNI